MATETEVRTDEEIQARERLDALRGAPYSERVSRLEERSEITWQMLLDERRLNQERFKTMLEKFDKVDEKFEKVSDKVDEKFDKVDEKFDKVDEKFDKVDEKFDRVDDKFDAIDAKFDSLYRMIIIGIISLGSIGVAGIGIIVTLMIFLLRG